MQIHLDVEFVRQKNKKNIIRNTNEGKAEESIEQTEQSCSEKCKNIIFSVLIIFLIGFLLFMADRLFLYGLFLGFPAAFIAGVFVHLFSFYDDNKKIKKTICFLIIALVFSLIASIFVLTAIKENKSVINIPCVIFCVISFICYFFLWVDNNKTQKKNKLQKKKNNIFDYFPFLSNEYILSDITKGESEDEDRSNIIKKNNYCNTIFSVLLFIIVFKFDALPEFNSACLCGLTGKNIIAGMLVARLLTRSFEISVAFFNDVIKGEPKSSNLSAGERIMLAVSSLLELVLSYAVYYYLSGSGKLEAITRSFGNSTLTDVSFFNAAGEMLPPSFCFVVAMQVITTFVLISFSIASYLNNIKSEEKNK